MVDPAWAADNIVSGLSSGEGIIWEVRDPTDENETGVSDKRRFIIEPEFAKVLRLNRRDGNTLHDVLRCAWDDGRLRVLNKNSPVKATSTHISLVGHITAEELRQQLTHMESVNGFANRFLWCCVRRSKYLPGGGHLTDTALQPLADRLADVLTTARWRNDIAFSDTAWQKWEEIYPELSDGRPGTVGSITSRAEAQAVRLALIYALVDKSPDIDLPHLEAALSCLDYVAQTARYVWGDSLGNPLADDILSHLKECLPDGMTRTQIFAGLGRHKRATDIRRALKLLEDSKLACREEEQTRGRPAERWYAGRTIPLK